MNAHLLINNRTQHLPVNPDVVDHDALRGLHLSGAAILAGTVLCMTSLCWFCLS